MTVTAAGDEQAVSRVRRFRLLACLLRYVSAKLSMRRTLARCRTPARMRHFHFFGLSFGRNNSKKLIRRTMHRLETAYLQDRREECEHGARLVKHCYCSVLFVVVENMLT